MYAPPAFPAESGFRSLGGGGGRSPSPMPSRRSLRPPPPPSRSRPRRQSLSTSPRRDRASLLRSRPRLDSSPPRGGLPLAPPSPRRPSRRRGSSRVAARVSDADDRFRTMKRNSTSESESAPYPDATRLRRSTRPRLWVGANLRTLATPFPPRESVSEAGCRSTCRRALIFWLFDFLAVPRRPFRIFNPQRSKEHGGVPKITSAHSHDRLVKRRRIPRFDVATGTSNAELSVDARTRSIPRLYLTFGDGVVGGCQPETPSEELLGSLLRKRSRSSCSDLARARSRWPARSEPPPGLR
jgi:hypothetical protein